MFLVIEILVIGFCLKFVDCVLGFVYKTCSLMSKTYKISETLLV